MTVTGGQVQEHAETEHGGGQGQAEDGQEAEEENLREEKPQDGLGGEPEQSQQENQDGGPAEEEEALKNIFTVFYYKNIKFNLIL